MSRIFVNRVNSYVPQTSNSWLIHDVNSNNFDLSTTTAVLFNVDDVLKVIVSYNGVDREVYGIVNSYKYDPLYEVNLVNIGFDGDVYGTLLSDPSGLTYNNVVSVNSYEINDTHKIMDIDLYSTVTEIELSSYSKNYKVYNSRESYSLSIPRNKYVFNSTIKQLYLGYDEKVLIDLCDRRCYKVTPGELTANSLNNKFSTSINLNVLVI
jgi:hypothetical protein